LPGLRIAIRGNTEQSAGGRWPKAGAEERWAAIRRGAEQRGQRGGGSGLGLGTEERVVLHAEGCASSRLAAPVVGHHDPPVQHIHELLYGRDARATGRDDHVEPGADAADPPPEEDDGQDPDDGPQDVHRFETHTPIQIRSLAVNEIQTKRGRKSCPLKPKVVREKEMREG